jgi:hypothetical protein
MLLLFQCRVASIKRSIWCPMWKYLKVAVTATSLLVCVLLVVLWIRSYFYRDMCLIHPGTTRKLLLVSEIGTMEFGFRTDYPDNGFIVIDSLPGISEMYPCCGRWHYFYEPFLMLIYIPHWFLIVITATIAALPWIKWRRRFSLRTLLVVMTLLALFFLTFGSVLHPLCLAEFSTPPFGRRPCVTVAWGNAPGRQRIAMLWPKAIFNTQLDR